MILFALWVISFSFLKTTAMFVFISYLSPFFTKSVKLLEQREIPCFDQITYFPQALPGDSQLAESPGTNTLHTVVL